jgi:hypothetical protein
VSHEIDLCVHGGVESLVAFAGESIVPVNVCGEIVRRELVEENESRPGDLSLDLVAVGVVVIHGGTEGDQLEWGLRALDL